MNSVCLEVSIGDTIPQSHNPWNIMESNYLTDAMECHGMATFHVSRGWRSACSTCSVKTSVEKCLPCWCTTSGAKSCQDTGRIPGISAGEPDPTAALAQFEGKFKHYLERCRFLVLDFMVLVRFVLVLTFSDIADIFDILAFCWGICP